MTAVAKPLIPLPMITASRSSGTASGLNSGKNILYCWHKAKVLDMIVVYTSSFKDAWLWGYFIFLIGYSPPRAYAVICSRFNITINWDYRYAPKQGKLTSVCLQRFSSIFETTILRFVLYKHGVLWWDLTNQGRPRSDAAQCGIRSVPALFAYRMLYEKFNRNRKYYPTALNQEMDSSNWEG